MTFLKRAVSPKRGSVRAQRVKNSHLEKGRIPKAGVAQYYSVGALSFLGTFF